MGVRINKPTGRGNTPRSNKTLPCKLCGEKVYNVDSKADGITCYRCVSKMCGGGGFIEPHKLNIKK
jgi:hypothetical protein